MPMSPAPPIQPESTTVDDLAEVLAHFEQMEAQFQKVREGLMHAHRLTTLGTLASTIAHEYNNILTPVISYAQLALAQPQDADLMRKAVEKALAGAERAARISSSLLGFARDQEEPPVARLRAVVDDAIACMARPPEKDGLRLLISVPDVEVAIEPVNLQQILLNLILNARKAMARRGGEVRISGEVQGGRLCLTVADTGPGIPPAIIDHLFEPFVTLPTADGDDEPGQRGTGLGLAICRDLVRRADGQIAVQSEPGRGACFILTIPLTAAAIETT